MTTTYLEREVLSQDAEFISRVKMAALDVASRVSAEHEFIPYHLERYLCARQVLEHPNDWAPRLALILAASGDGEDGSTDEQLFGAIYVNWNGISGIATISQMAELNDVAETVTVAALACIDNLSLHSEHPGEDGTVGELTGGNPAYAREACTWGTPVPERLPLGADVTWDIPAASTIAYVGLWDSTVYMGCFAVVEDVYAAQGTYTLRAADMTLIC